MAAHPIEAVVQPGIQVPKTAFNTYIEGRTPLILTNAAEIQGLVLPLTTIVSLEGKLFEYEAGDTTSTHDGERTLVDATPVTGRRYKRRQRTVLTANRTIYVRTDGSDTSTGLIDAAGAAFLTIQRALDTAFNIYDLNGFDVTIQIRTGTFARGIVTTPQVGKGNIILQGDGATPANVILSAALVSTTTGVVDVQNYGVLTVKDVTIQGSGSGACMYAGLGGLIYFTNVRFGTFTGGAHILASQGGAVTATGNYNIVGAANLHVWANDRGSIRVQSRTLTITGTPAFATAFALADYGGIATINGNTYSGSATGVRFAAQYNGVIVAFGGLAELPGNAAGTVGNGGIHPALGDQESFIVACTDNSTAIATGSNKAKFRMPYAFTVTAVRASLYTAQATSGGGGLFTVDINKNLTTILSTKLTFDNTEVTTQTAATPPVISVTTFADDDEVEFDVDQIGDGTARGLIVTLIGFRT